MSEREPDGVKVDVYVCHCGLNIASKVDVSRVVAAAAELPEVSVAREYSSCVPTRARSSSRGTCGKAW